MSLDFLILVWQQCTFVMVSTFYLHFLLFLLLLLFLVLLLNARPLLMQPLLLLLLLQPDLLPLLGFSPHFVLNLQKKEKG